MESNILTLALSEIKTRRFNLGIYNDSEYITARHVRNTLEVLQHVCFIEKCIADPDYNFRVLIRNVEVLPAWERTDNLMVLPFIELEFPTEEEAILYKLTNPLNLEFGSNEFSDNTLSLSNDDNRVKRINIHG